MVYVDNIVECGNAVDNILDIDFTKLLCVNNTACTYNENRINKRI